MGTLIQITYKGKPYTCYPFKFYHPYNHTPGLLPYQRTNTDKWNLVAFNQDRQVLEFWSVDDITEWCPL